MPTQEDSSVVFNLNALHYDQWFDNHPSIFQSELLALQMAIPKNKKGVEIGVGSGRFAQALNIRYGVEPSENMAIMAEGRGIITFRGWAEHLPLEDASFDFALMVTTVCFLSDMTLALKEVRRILKPDGEIIIAFIDKNSALGRKYELEKVNNKYYKNAHFYSTEELITYLEEARFEHLQFWQTLQTQIRDTVEQPEPGYGKGSFVIVKAQLGSSPP